MKSLIKLSIVLLIFLAKTHTSIAQTYITPVVGYEWNFASPQQNLWNWVNNFKIPNTLPLHSLNVGVLSKRKFSPRSYLCTGIIYSKYYFDIFFAPFTGPANDLDLQMKSSRIRALLGSEFNAFENFYVSSNLSVNYIYGSKIWHQMDRDIPEYYPENRTHLGLLFGAHYKLNNFLLGFYLEYGFWNLKGQTDIAATRPISGFGFLVGYQFKW